MYTNDTIAASGETTDADGDTVTLTYAWTVDDTVVSETGGTLDGTVYFEKNQVVYAEATPGDGIDSGAALASNSITILLRRKTPYSCPS